MEDFNKLQVKNGFAISGENTRNYERVLLTFKSVDKVRKSELREGHYIVRIRDNDVIHIKTGVNRLRKLTDDETLQIRLKYTQELPKLGSLLHDDDKDAPRKWFDSLPDDLQKINRIVEENALISNKKFTFTPLYRLIHERLSNAAEKNCKYMIITSDFLVGCGYTFENCARTIRRMEQTLLDHCEVSSRVSVYDVCDRLTYNGYGIANPISGSYTNICLIVPMDKLALIFYNSGHPSAKSIGNCLSSLCNATIIYALEKNNKKLDNFAKEIKFAQNENNVSLKERERLEAKLKETAQELEISEDQRNSLRNVHTKSSIATSRYNGGACLVFAFSDRNYSFLCRTNGNGSFFSATEDGIRYVCSADYKKRDQDDLRPRLVMSVTGADAPICIRDSVRNQFVKNNCFMKGNELSFADPPSQQKLMDMVSEVTGTDIKIFSENGAVYQDGREIEVIDPSTEHCEEILKHEKNLPELERRRRHLARRMDFNTLRCIKDYNAHRREEESYLQRGEKRKREESETLL